MEFLLFTLVLLIGICIGALLNRWYIKLSNRVEMLKKIKDINYHYSNVLTNIKNNKTSFISRLNNSIYIETKLPNLGDVEIVYFLDKTDVVILKDKKVILTSELVDETILIEISNCINITHYDEINDVIEVMGLLFSRIDFEKTFNMNLDDLKNKMNSNVSEIDKIIEENEFKFEIDSILDKISRVGIDNLSKEEKDFLDNYKL